MCAEIDPEGYHEWEKAVEYSRRMKNSKNGSAFGYTYKFLDFGGQQIWAD